MEPADSALQAAFAANRALALWSFGVVVFGTVWQTALLWWASRGGQSRRDTVGLIGASMLVLTGLGCVVWFGTQAGGAAAALVRDADERVAAFNAAAEAERTKAALAAEQIATLTRDTAMAAERTAELERQAAEARRDAETGRLEAERARTALLPLEQQLADTRLTLEQIRTNLTWREIRPDGLQQLAGVLAEGSGRVSIQWTDNDPEALNLAIQLSQAFRLANQQAGARQWIVKGDPKVSSRALLRGLFVPGPYNDSVATVRRAFEAVGLAFTTDDAPGVARAPDEDVVVVVGTKPVPF